MQEKARAVRWAAVGDEAREISKLADMSRALGIAPPPKRRSSNLIAEGEHAGVAVEGGVAEGRPTLAIEGDHPEPCSNLVRC